MVWHLVSPMITVEFVEVMVLLVLQLALPPIVMIVLVMVLLIVSGANMTRNATRKPTNLLPVLNLKMPIARICFWDLQQPRLQELELVL